MLLRYYLAVKALVDDFDYFEMYHIPRESNTRVDLLSKLVSMKRTRHLKTIIQETIQALTIDTNEVMEGEEEESDWMAPYKNFLIERLLPPDENEARDLKRKDSYYVIFDDELLKVRLTTPLLKCLNNQQADYVMR